MSTGPATGSGAGIRVERVGPEATAAVREIVLAAFGARPALDPPSDALTETEEALARALAGHRGLLATVDGRPSGVGVLHTDPERVYLRRFGVAPWAQGQGVAGALVDAAVDAALGIPDLVVHARPELPKTVDFWRAQGFVDAGRDGVHLRLHRPLATTFEAPDADDMRRLGERAARALVAGDLVVLDGQLGAGKTTFTQGLGAGLGVRGDVTSPTFVIARVHPSLGCGPDLVHVDAYRLGGAAELDDLDLDTALEESVTVVEWGAGLAESLAGSRLEVAIDRALADDGAGAGHDGRDPRRVSFRRITEQ